MKRREKSSATLVAAAGFALLATGCRSPVVAGDPIAAGDEGPLRLEVVSGDGQFGVCFEELSNPLEVKATRGGTPAPQEPVDFEVVEGEGWVSSGSVTTDASGIAQEYWTLGYPGPQTLEVRALDVNGATLLRTFTATATPRPPEATRITEDEVSQGRPVISGDRIVWQADFDIFLYDLVTQTETRITSSGAACCADISGDRIAWVDERDGYPQIYLYDLSTRTEMPITGDAARPVTEFGAGLAISGDWIVWEDERDIAVDYDIYLYDLLTKSEIQLTHTGTACCVAISGDRIVWVDEETGFAYLYDLGTQSQTQISDTPGGMNALAISGDRIVWLNFFVVNQIVRHDLYFFDLGTQSQIQITDTGTAANPAISGDRIVWEDYRKSGPDIYLYDVRTRSEMRISEDTPWASAPSISGDRVVWQEEAALFLPHDIYLADLSREPPPCISPNP
jgi:beta propeller repeat protein